jgi:hypothetical protein
LNRLVVYQNRLNITDHILQELNRTPARPATPDRNAVRPPVQPNNPVKTKY